VEAFAYLAVGSNCKENKNQACPRNSCRRTMDNGEVKGRWKEIEK